MYIDWSFLWLFKGSVAKIDIKKEDENKMEGKGNEENAADEGLQDMSSK